MINTRSTLSRFVLVVAATSIVLAACGAAESDEPETGSTPSTAAPPTSPETSAPPSTEGPAIGDAAIIAVVELTGGCQMMGPNCPTYVIWSDGRAAVVRGTPPVDPFGERLPEDAVEAVGFVDPSLAIALADVASSTDFPALLERLGPGVCNGCVDGIDTIVSVATLSGIVTLSSTEVDFTATEPLFAALDDVVVALGQELPLALESR